MLGLFVAPDPLLKVTFAKGVGVPLVEITPALADALCAAKTVRITGSVSDTATGETTPLDTAPFAVTGCGG